MNTERLKQLRELKGLKQIDVARQLGLRQQRYNFIENGRNEPDNETLLLLAEYFGVSTDYLLGHETKPDIEVWDRDLGRYVPVEPREITAQKKEAPPTFAEVEEAYLDMLLRKKGTSLEDLNLTDADKEQLRRAFEALVKEYGK